MSFFSRFNRKSGKSDDGIDAENNMDVHKFLSFVNSTPKRGKSIGLIVWAWLWLIVGSIVWAVWLLDKDYSLLSRHPRGTHFRIPQEVDWVPAFVGYMLVPFVLGLMVAGFITMVSLKGNFDFERCFRWCVLFFVALCLCSPVFLGWSM